MSESLIQLHEVRKTYRVGAESVHALDGVSLAIAPNEYLAVMGPSGSGKSTLMNILGCLDRPTSGDYRFGGRSVARMGAGALARVRNRRIGFVFQSFELLPRLSALENVCLPLLYTSDACWSHRRRARHVLDRVGLADRMRHRPNQLSGGQKQRVTIARALVTEPSLLLADEPTGNLDSRTSADILALFDRLHRDGQTIILVTHETDVARHTGRIVRLHDGKIASDLPADREAAGEGHP